MFYPCKFGYRSLNGIASGSGFVCVLYDDIYTFFNKYVDPFSLVIRYSSI